MSLSLRDLENLAALNPCRWHALSQDQLDKLVELAGIEPIFRPIAGHPYSPGTGKTVITRAVLAKIEKEDPALFEKLPDPHQSVKRDGERLVFECLERLIVVRRRDELAGVSQLTRGEPINPAPTRPFM